MTGPALTHYDALEVSPNASPEVIRAAYKSLMQRFHPDKNPGDEAVAARAAAIVQAYAVLSDAGKRAEYNNILQQAVSPPAPFAQADWTSPSPVRPAGQRPGTPAAAPGSALMRWGFWGLLFLVAVGAFWAFASRTAKVDPRAELASIQRGFASAATTEAQRRELYARKLAILEQHPQLLRAATAEKAEDMAARSFALLEAPLVVWVSGGAAGRAAQLTVENISLQVGSFDAPPLLAHMARHRERMIQDLTARLAKEDPDRFARPEGEQYLKQVVLEAAAASLDTKGVRDYPSTYFESPGRYGVVDVLLPDRFKLQFSA